MCLHGQASFWSYLLYARTGVAKLATFAEILVAKFFSTRHGDQNGHSLEHCLHAYMDSDIATVQCVHFRQK